MSTLQLSSYERMRRYLGDDDRQAITASVYKRRELLTWINSVSDAIERYLDRTLLIDDYTEYFRVRFGQTEFFPKAPPITAITSVYEDPLGLWDTTNEAEIDDPIIGHFSNSVIIPDTLAFEVMKGVRIIYTGGMAYSGVQSVFTVTDATAFTSGKFIVGTTSGALGIVRGGVTTALTVEVLGGKFTTEAITEYTTEDESDATAITDTISAVAQQSLAESYPAIVQACEIQVLHMYKEKQTLELITQSRDGSSVRRQQPSVANPFLAEATRFLQPYRRPSLG